MIRYLITSLSLLCFFSSCEEEVTIDIERISDRQLVVISNIRSSANNGLTGDNFLSRNSGMRVTVSRPERAWASGDTLIDVPGIEEGNVELYLGTQILRTLIYYSPTEEEKELGIQPYFEEDPNTESYPFVAGETYNLKAFVPNIGIATAEAYIPAIVSELIDPSVFILKDTTNNGFIDLTFTLNLGIPNLPVINNYFHLNLYANLLKSNTTIVDTLLGPLAFDLQNNDQEVLPYIDNCGVLIRDDSFDGGTGHFTFKGNLLYDPNSYDLGDFIIELRNTSEDYYLYHSSLARQVRIQSGFDLISGAVVLHDNIEDGIGIFAGYAPFFVEIEPTK